MKILRIGDPHVKPGNLAESEKLMHFINDMILEFKPDRVEFLGDLHHTHDIVRLSVLEFWDGWMDVFTTHENIEFYVVVGNHDMASHVENAPNALMAFNKWRKKNLKVVSLPRVDGIYAYIPYYHDNETFIDVANRCVDQGAKVIVCHATFDGSKYESGTYAPDGIDPSKVKCNTIISGHIHSRQVIKNGSQTISYPGTPKWDTVADANEEKGIWLYEHDDVTGEILSENLIPTDGVVTKIVSLQWNEGDPMPTIPTGCKVAIELIGSSEWVLKQKKVLKGQVAIQTTITDKIDKTVRQSGKDLSDFIKNLFITTCDREHLLQRMKEMGIV